MTGQTATPTYRDRAACRVEVKQLIAEGWPTEEAYAPWFPPGETYLPQHVAHAKAVCNGGPIPGRPDDVRPPCPVRAECLAEHLLVKHGVYGGLTPTERDSLARRLRRLRRKAVSA